MSKLRLLAAFAAASSAFVLFGALLGPGCTPSATALCDRICECAGCSESQRAECVDDLEDAERAADDAGCSLEFNDVARCFDAELECRNEAYKVDGCDSESEELRRCALDVDVGIFGDPCQSANTRMLARFESCGIDVGDPGDVEQIECTDQVARQTACFAECVDAASCGALNGEDSNASLAFSECLGGC